MRPGSIRKFDWLFLGSLALSVLAFVLNYDAIVAQVDRELVASGIEAGAGLAEKSLIFSVIVNLALWFLVSRLRIGFVRWLLIVFFAIGAIGIPAALAQLPALHAVVNLLVFVMQLGAFWFLFQPDARAWFAARRGSPGDS